MPLTAQTPTQGKTTEEQQFREALADVAEVVALLAPYYKTSEHLTEAVQLALSNDGQLSLFLTMLHASRGNK